MTLINRKPVNVEDCVSVALGVVHNVGAGGVGRMGQRAVGGARFLEMSDKRFAQWCIRADRAVGVRL